MRFFQVKDRFGFTYTVNADEVTMIKDDPMPDRVEIGPIIYLKNGDRIECRKIVTVSTILSVISDAFKPEELSELIRQEKNN